MKTVGSPSRACRGFFRDGIVLFESILGCWTREFRWQEAVNLCLVSVVSKAHGSAHSRKMMSVITQMLPIPSIGNDHGPKQIAYRRINHRMPEFGAGWCTSASHNPNTFYSGLNSIAFQKREQIISAPGPTSSSKKHCNSRRLWIKFCIPAAVAWIPQYKTI